jgi:hypothetical protein
MSPYLLLGCENDLEFPCFFKILTYFVSGDEVKSRASLMLGKITLPWSNISRLTFTVSRIIHQILCTTYLN